MSDESVSGVHDGHRWIESVNSWAGARGYASVFYGIPMFSAIKANICINV
jgi:hypothetical protein